MKTLLYCALGALLTTSVVADAQNARPPREDRRSQREQGNDNLTPEQRRQNFQSRMQERMQSMTPEQRQQVQERIAAFQQKMQDAGIDPNDPDAWQKARDAGLMGQRGGGDNNGQDGERSNRGGRGSRSERAAADAMRQMMESAGIVDFDVQDAIIAYMAEQNKARATLFQLAQTAARALQAPVVQPINAGAGDVAGKTADTKVASTFKAYETAAKAENERQEKALKALDAKINYSGTPRIKAFLTLVGILNKDVWDVGGPTAIFVLPQQNGMMEAGMDGQGQGGWDGGQGRGGWNRGQDGP